MAESNVTKPSTEETQKLTKLESVVVTTFNYGTKAAVSVAKYVVRLQLICFLYLYNLFLQAMKSVATPFEPVFEQVRKVPKKDVSVKGIFYQVLRLQFLVCLYLSPFFWKAVEFVSQPLRKWQKKALVFLDEPATVSTKQE